MMPNCVIVIGAGIGGLTCALALAQAGQAVTLVEQAPQITALGAGMTIGPNGVRVLEALDVMPPIRRAPMASPGALFLHYRTGASVLVLKSDHRPETTPEGRASVQMLRSDLQDALLRQVESTPGIALHLGQTLAAVEQGPDGVFALMAGGERHRGDLLVGCDGIRSAVRTALFGPEMPRFTGQVAWRCLIPRARAEPFMSAGRSTVFVGEGGLFNRYVVDGGAQVNCVAIARADRWREEGWRVPSTFAEFHETFAGWHHDVVELVRQAGDGELHKSALFDRDPLPAWGTGRATLLGDAAHAMLPFMGMGATLALEDAMILARCLALDPSQAGLRQYEQLRMKRCACAVEDSRRQGDIYQSPDTFAQMKADGELRLAYTDYDAVNMAL